jgi:hypothetical protein
MRISHSGSRYAVCPNGHGRLVPRFSKSEAKQAFVATLPRARRVGRSRFTIQGHEGLFCYRQRSGLRPVQPGASIAPDELIACRVARKRRLIRVFARKPVLTKSGGDGAS